MKLTTPQMFAANALQQKQPVTDNTEAIRCEIEAVLTAGKLTVDMRGKNCFNDLAQVQSVLREYREAGWTCDWMLERCPGGRREIIFKVML